MLRPVHNAQLDFILSREIPDIVFLAETNFTLLRMELAQDANLRGA